MRELYKEIAHSMANHIYKRLLGSDQLYSFTYWLICTVLCFALLGLIVLHSASPLILQSYRSYSLTLHSIHIYYICIYMCIYMRCDERGSLSIWHTMCGFSFIVSIPLRIALYVVVALFSHMSCLCLCLTADISITVFVTELYSQYLCPLL